MSIQLNDMNAVYEIFVANAPEVDNPHLDKSSPYVEQLIRCRCSKQYRVFVNGNIPISDSTMPDVECPHCGAAASEFQSISGHSADVFNATLLRVVNHGA